MPPARSPVERPIVAQIWGNEPEAYFRAAAKLVGMGFDGIDINMGCPVRKIKKKGACSRLILQPALAAELIAAAREGADSVVSDEGVPPADARFPISVKTRIGFSGPRTEKWIGHLLSCDLDALTVHGRYAEQESEGEADWEEIARAASLAREMGVPTAVLGNGDVVSGEEIREKSERYRLDGVMVGRGIFRDPYLFAPGRGAGSPPKSFLDSPAHEKVELLLDHVRLHREVWGGTRNYEILKKFYKVYLVGFPDADDLRERLNRTHDYESAEDVVAAWFTAGAGRPVRLHEPGAS